MIISSEIIPYPKYLQKWIFCKNCTFVMIQIEKFFTHKATHNIAAASFYIYVINFFIFQSLPLEHRLSITKNLINRIPLSITYIENYIKDSRSQLKINICDQFQSNKNLNFHFKLISQIGR
jgi:hypothetical protein